jgi:hypothetical protein
MLGAAASIAWHVVIEAARNRLGWVLAGLTALALGAAAFAGALALTESIQTQVVLGAALLRIVAVFLVAGFVVTSIAREATDKGQEMLLALALPRSAYLLGKLAGFCLVALAPALLFGAIALVFAPAPWALVWSVSLACELWIVAAFALLAALGMRQLLAALAATLAFYMLARAIGGIAALADSRVVDVLSALLPHLDGFTRADWLVYGAGMRELMPVLAQTALYVPLLAAAALADLYRKNI